MENHFRRIEDVSAFMTSPLNLLFILSNKRHANLLGVFFVVGVNTQGTRGTGTAQYTGPESTSKVSMFTEGKENARAASFRLTHTDTRTAGS